MHLAAGVLGSAVLAGEFVNRLDGGHGSQGYRYGQHHVGGVVPRGVLVPHLSPDENLQKCGHEETRGEHEHACTHGVVVFNGTQI
jgi:hypothetical protein